MIGSFQAVRPWAEVLRACMLGICLAFGMATAGRAEDDSDPLPSWNDGEVKQAVLEFVKRVTTEGSPDYVAPAARIAVFDNDGTLWPENPLPFQLIFALDEIRRLSPEHPEWQDNATIQAAIRGDAGAIARSGLEGLAEIIAVTHSGMTVEDFNARVKEWLDRARHPRFQRPFQDLGYQPMKELLNHLRAKEFKVFIVSGGGIDFMRVWTEQAYGIPPEQVIGSYAKVRYQLQDGHPKLIKEAAIELVDDKAGKPAGIHRFIGRKPILCVGNSDGDQAMLEWTTIDHSPSLGVILHHTDDEREYAYDREPKSSGKLIESLEAASQRGWVVIDMKKDWNRVFSE